MADLASGCSIIPFFLFILFLLSVSFNLTTAQTGDDNQICSHDLSSFLPPPYGNLTELNCQSVWNTFVLRHSQSKDSNVVSIVLSALYTTGWVGIGFSKNGKMAGASAMVGWVTQTGHARIKQYKLKGYSSEEVKPEKGDLNLTDISPVVVLNGANIFLAFQLKFTAPIMNQPTLFAFGSRYPVLNTHELSKHDDKTSMLINYYSSGEADKTTSVELDSHEKMKRSHGALGVIGWGLVLPMGAMVARFMRHKDPLWYYLHTIIQFSGFLIVLAGVVVGQALYSHHGHSSNLAAHRGIGYFALTLSITQVLAFFARPNKESKFRRIWNAYHLSFGVLALFFGALNILLGIQIGGAGSEWKIGYGFLLGVILVAVIVLQVLKMLRSDSELKTSQPPPSHNFQMN